VTECIVEVLSNALSKPNAPPINPDCKEILKKGGRNDRERSENSQPEVRHWKDTAETAKHLPGSMEEEQRQAEDEAKESMKGSDVKKLAQEEDKSKEDETGHHSAAEEEGLHREEKKHHQEIREEEEKSYQSEEESQGHDKEVELGVLNKSPSEGMSAEELPAGGEQQSRWRLQVARQSPYKRVPEGEEGEADKERSEKPHQESKEGDFSHQQQYAESEEIEETEEKPPYSPRRYGKQRVGDSSEEKRGHGGEEEESKTEERHRWDKRNQHQNQHKASQQQREEKNGYHRRRVSEVEEKRRAGQGGEEYRERWQQSEESSEEEEEEEKSHQQREDSDERWQEERRHRDGAQEAQRHSLEGWTHLGGESRQELDKYRGGGSKEKQQGGGSSWWASEEDDSQKAFAGERRAEAGTHHGTRDSAEQLSHLGNGQEREEVERQHQSNEQREDEEEDLEEGRYAEREAYRSRIPAESKKRTAAAYSQLYPLLWWSRHLEKREGKGEQLLEGKEEGGPGLAEQTLLPEYDDYEWWEKQQPSRGAPRQGRPQPKSMGSRVPAKRQHEVEQLPQLLSYRKKAAEFPELYTSREDTRRHQASRSDRRLSQRPLTEEE
ncbi:SCG1 protein, partial [Psilopogon haemacephalus]|nr:SCG1 protein [Psilopogon haemacephalus]